MASWSPRLEAEGSPPMMGPRMRRCGRFSLSRVRMVSGAPMARTGVPVRKRRTRTPEWRLPAKQLWRRRRREKS